MNKQFLTIFFIAFCLNVSLAQRVVTGTVTGEGEILPLQGVQVSVQGASVRTTTDHDGQYSINAETGDVLIFAIRGFQSTSVTVDARAIIDIMLLSEVSGDASSNTVGTVSKINADQLGTQPVVDLEQATQGRAAGVFVQNSGGQLGAGTKVRIRGGSSLSGSNSPLYVVDGIPLTSDNQSDIDPSTIASMEILKDAAATAIYGSRAANGVVLITTKKGQSGKLKADVNYQLAISQEPKRLNMMSPDDYQILFFEYTLRALLAGLPLSDGAVSATNLGSLITQDNLKLWFKDLEGLASNATSNSITYQFPNGDQMTLSPNNPIFRNIYNTDWQDEIFRTSFSHRTNVSLSGGNDVHQVFGSVNYLDQEGFLIGNDYERFGGRLNINSQWSGKFSSALNVGYVKTNNNKLNEDADTGNPMQAILLPTADAPNPANNLYPIVRSTEYNPLTEIEYSDNFETSDRVNLSATLGYQINDELSFNLDGGLDLLSLTAERRQGPETEDGAVTGLSRLTETEVFNYQIDGYFQYNKELAGNPLTATLGGSYQYSNTAFTYRQARVNSIDQLRSLGSDDPSLLALPVPGSAFSFLSSYLQADYTINDKYNLSVTGRLDGSSKFSEENRFGFFPAIGAGWIISNESFMSGVGILSNLELNASYGIVGNAPDEDFLYRANYFNVLYGENSAIRLANLANKDLKWESTAQLDVGVSFGILENRISGSFNYYQKNTSDLLIPVPVTQTSGVSSVLRNVGAMTNSGIEVALSTINVEGNQFSWSTDFNLATNVAEITDLGGQRLIQSPNAFILNESPGVFYLPNYMGVNANNGLPQYEVNGAPSSNYELALSNYRTVVGNPNPKYFGGLSNALSYGDFDLSFTFQFVYDVDIYWETGEYIANSGYANFSQLADQSDRWYNISDPGTYPSLNPTVSTTNPSSRWIVDGSYLRLNNVNLSYTLDESKLGSLPFRYITIYVGGQNLYTWTSYPGYDPDVNSVDPNGGALASNINRGIDFFTAPQPRVYTTGLKLGF